MMQHDPWISIGAAASGVVAGLRDQQMRREFLRRVDCERFAELCALHGVDPASIPDAPVSEAAE